MSYADKQADRLARYRVERSLQALQAAFETMLNTPLPDSASQAQRDGRARAILTFDLEAEQTRAWYQGNQAPGLEIEDAYQAKAGRLAHLLNVIIGRYEYRELEHTPSG